VRAFRTLAAGLLLAGAALALSRPAWAEPTIHARLDRVERVYDVHPDLTYVETITVDATALTLRGIRERDHTSRNFSPETQKLEVVEAWTEEADGTRVPVGEGARFTRPSAAAQNTPGFTGTMTTTVLFPQMREGSHTHIVWRLTQTRPALLGLNVESVPPLDIPTGALDLHIAAPASVPLHWAARGGFAVTERTDADGIHRIDAHIAGTKPEEEERGSVDADDWAPMFLLTSLGGLRDLGAIYYRESLPHAVATPEIAALAARVANGAQGLDAARAVYDWVAGNIRYVAVYMNPDDGWVPHDAAEVLRRGYGDCKDHVVLMQAMLASLGVQAVPALVYEGRRTADLPMWVPQFNHVMVWLPAFQRFANPTNPFARLGSADPLLADRTVVLATAQGEVARTPPLRPAENAYRIDSLVTLRADGTIEGSARLHTEAGLEASMRAAVAQSTGLDDLAERVLGGTPEGGFGTFSASDPRDLTGPFDISGTWVSPHGATLAGEVFLPIPTGLDLDPPARLRELLSPKPRRHSVFTEARDDRWTTTLTLPPGFAVTRLPVDVDVSNDVGSYRARYVSEGRQVRVERRFVLDRSVVPPEQAKALEALVYAAGDDSRAVLGATAGASVASRGPWGE
jgi:hypothetical protein